MTNRSEDNQSRLRIPNPHEKISVPGSKPFAVLRDVFEGTTLTLPATEIPLSNNWDDIPAINKLRSITVEKSEDLVFVVELPLYKACRMLYNAGIITTESNAHFNPGEEEALVFLGIKWDSLTPSQKNLAEVLCAKEPDKWKHYSAKENGDGYEAVYFNWKIKKNEVSPRQVKAYVDAKAQELIRGRIKIRV